MSAAPLLGYIECLDVALVAGQVIAFGHVQQQQQHPSSINQSISKCLLACSVLTQYVVIPAVDDPTAHDTISTHEKDLHGGI